ncbi:MAG: septum site-determining protein MinC, partial [Bacillota bacterium]
DGSMVQNREGRNLIVIDERDAFSKVRTKLERIVTLEGVLGGARLDIDFGRRLLDSDQLRKIKKILEPVPGMVHIIHGQNEEILYKKAPKAPAAGSAPAAPTPPAKPAPPAPTPPAKPAPPVAPATPATSEVAATAPKTAILDPPAEVVAAKPAAAVAIKPAGATAAKAADGEPFEGLLDQTFPSGPGPLFTIQSGRARPKPPPERAPDFPSVAAEAGAPPPDDEALILRRTLRSGQVVHYPGHVSILGDVNPGGEVIAGGDIIVLGILRGVAHAGAGGNDQAVVAAFRLRPTQLRIGNHIARAPDEETGGPEAPEIAKVRNGVVVIEPYHGLGE